MTHTSRIVSGYRSQPASCRNSLLMPTEYNVSNFSEDLSSFDIQFKKLMERTEKFTSRVEKLQSVSSNIKKSFRRLDSSVSGLRTHFDGTDDETVDRHRKESLTTEEEWKKYLDAGVLIEKAVELLRQHINFPKPAFEYSPDERSPYSFDISSNTSLVSMPSSPIEDGAKLQLFGNNLREKNVNLAKNVENLPLEAIKEETNKYRDHGDDTFGMPNIINPQKNKLSSKKNSKAKNGGHSESYVFHRNKANQVSKDSRDSRTKSLFEISSVDTSPWIQNLNLNDVTKAVNGNVSTEKNNLDKDNKSSNRNNYTFNDKKNDENTQEIRNKKSNSSSFHEYNTSNRIPLRERLAMKEKEKEEAKNREQVSDSKNLVIQSSKQTKIKTSKENGSKEGDSLKSRFLRQFKRNDKNEKCELEATKERRRTTRKRSDEDISLTQPTVVQEVSRNKDTSFEKSLICDKTSEQKIDCTSTTEQKTDFKSNELIKRISNKYSPKNKTLDKESNKKLENNSNYLNYVIESHCNNLDSADKQQNKMFSSHTTDDHFKNHSQNQQSNAMFSNYVNNLDIMNNNNIDNNEIKDHNKNLDIKNKQQVIYYAKDNQSNYSTDNQSSYAIENKNKNQDIINLQNNKKVLLTDNFFATSYHPHEPSTSNHSHEFSTSNYTKESSASNQSHKFFSSNQTHECSENVNDSKQIIYLNKNSTKQVFERTIKHNSICLENTMQPIQTSFANAIKSIESCFENTIKPSETYFDSSNPCESLQEQLPEQINLKIFKEESIYPMIIKSKEVDFSRVLTILKDFHRPVSEDSITVISKVDQIHLDTMDINIENHNSDFINKLEKSDVTNISLLSLNFSIQQSKNNLNSLIFSDKSENCLKDYNNVIKCHENNLINNPDFVLNFAQKTPFMNNEESTVNTINSFDEMLNEFEKLTNEMHESLQNLNSTAKKKEEVLISQCKKTLNESLLVDISFISQNGEEQTEILSKLKAAASKELAAFTKKNTFTKNYLDINEELNKKNSVSNTLNNKEFLLSHEISPDSKKINKSKIPVLMKNECNLYDKSEKTGVSETSLLYSVTNNGEKAISTNVLQSDGFINDVNFRESSSFMVERNMKNKEKRMSYREKREAHMHLLRKKSSNEENILSLELSTSCN